MIHVILPYIWHPPSPVPDLMLRLSAAQVAMTLCEATLLSCPFSTKKKKLTNDRRRRRVFFDTTKHGSLGKIWRIARVYNLCGLENQFSKR